MCNILKTVRKWRPRKCVITSALKTIIHALFDLGTYLMERKYLVRPDVLSEVYFAYVVKISDVLIIHQNESFVCTVMLISP